MKRSTIIASCLVNSGMIDELDHAERAVEQIFRDEFPRQDYAVWNSEVDEKKAHQIIKNVGRASRVNVRMFIDDLR